MKNLKILVVLAVLFPMLAMTQVTYLYPLDVTYNEADEVYYVSNWANGEGGYILVVNTEGVIISTLFSGLSYAGGLCLIDDILYVTDNSDLYGGSLPSYLVMVDINTGAELDRVEIASGGTYLDFIEADDNGNLFIGDSEKFCIYKYNIGSQDLSTFLTGINKPFGICYDYIEDRLLYVDSEADVSYIKSVSTDGGEVTPVFWWPGWIEGLIMNDEGEYFISSWEGNGVAWGNEQVYKLNHDLDWSYELSTTENRPFGMCLGHDNILAICNWGGHSVNFFDLTLYGTDDLAADLQTLRIYPNPGNGYFHVTVPAIQSGNASLTVLDMNSRVVADRSLRNTSMEQEITLDLAFLPAGIYILVVQEGTTIYREKLVIQ